MLSMISYAEEKWNKKGRKKLEKRKGESRLGGTYEYSFKE